MHPTDRYRHTLRRANQVAVRSGHAKLEPEDLALALLESSGVGAGAIHKQGFKLRRIRQRFIDHFQIPQAATEGFIRTAIGVLRSFATGRWPAAEKPLEHSDTTVKVLALAPEEAESLRHLYVGTEHILLGLLREGGSVACFFQAEGITHDCCREAINALLGHCKPSP
jgi:ATP-dependent Clp protease ATP-binding subunit ClpA